MTLRWLQVRVGGTKRAAAAKSIAEFVKEAVEKLLTDHSEELGQLDSIQQLASGLADTSPNTQATVGASPLRSHLQNGHANGAAGTQQASPVRSHKQSGSAIAAGTQQEYTRPKGSSSEATHAQRSSSRSVTSQPAEKTDASRAAAEANMAEPTTLALNLTNQATQPAAALQETVPTDAGTCAGEEATAVEWRMTLPKIAEASAECNGTSGSAQQVFAKQTFKDGQGTLETPSLFQNTNQQPQSLAQPDSPTHAGSEDTLSAHGKSATIGHDAAQDNEMADVADSPTADRENVPDNIDSPFSQSQGKARQAAEAAGISLRLSLQGAGGQGAPEAHAQEWEDMD